MKVVSTGPFSIKNGSGITYSEWFSLKNDSKISENEWNKGK
jgi:hypothetical protein